MTFEMLVMNTERAINNISLLSERERELLYLAAEGLSNKQVAACLYITEDTVDSQNRNIVTKLQATNMKQAIAIGIRRRIIE